MDCSACDSFDFPHPPAALDFPALQHVDFAFHPAARVNAQDAEGRRHPPGDDAQTGRAGVEEQFAALAAVLRLMGMPVDDDIGVRASPQNYIAVALKTVPCRRRGLLSHQ